MREHLAYSLGKSVPGKGSGKCKDSDANTCLADWRNSKNGSAPEQRKQVRSLADEVAGLAHFTWVLQALRLMWSEIGSHGSVG